jgi:hypothetical protein
MKTLKTALVTLVLLLLTFNTLIAQEEKKEPNTMLFVHTDNVNFSMLQEFERLAKELKDNCVKHNVQSVNWTVISLEDGRYVYATPIENMAELDKNGMAELFDKMGEDAAKQLFTSMNKCYDSHSDSIAYHIPALSYMPEGFNKEGKNYREYHFIYYTPQNSEAMYNAMKKVKDIFKAKGVKNGYDVYHSGFGDKESYFLVSIPALDSVEKAQNGKENKNTFGDEGDAALFSVIQLAMKYDQIEGMIRPDLSYYPKPDKQ